ncbi:PAS domain S-box protein, partial [Candidatus Pacearchaeota archaeon]|nr:PAS domain S-box protein [Candidatus Pacearchaeota archaeon]
MSKKPTYEKLERKVFEQDRLEKRLRLLSLAVDQSSEGIAVVDLDGNLQYLNNAFAKMHGYSTEELVGKNLSIFHTLDQMPSVEAANLETKQTGFFKGEIWHVRRDGAVFPTMMHNSIIRDEKNMPIGIMGTLRDISDMKQTEEALRESERKTGTERKRTEESLREREKQIRLLLDSTAEAIYGLDMNGNCTFVNPACLKLLGFKATDDLIGKNMHSLIHHTRLDGSSYPVEECRIYQAFRRGEGSHVDDEVLWRAGGTSFPAEYWSYPIFEDDKVIGSVVTFLDITERKQTEDALRESEEKYRLLIDNLPNIVFKGYKDGSVDFTDDKIELLTGYKKDEFNFRRINWFDIVVEEDKEKMRQTFIKALKTNKSYIREYRIKTKAGGVLWIQEGSQILCVEGGGIEYISGAFLDITERKIAEEDLKESEKKYRDIFENVSDFLYFHDLEGNFIETNFAFNKAYGLNKEASTLPNLIDMVPERYKSQVNDYMERIKKNGKDEGLINVITKDGRKLIIEYKNSLVYDSKGISIGVQGSGRDITERIQAKKEKKKL